MNSAHCGQLCFTLNNTLTTIQPNSIFKVSEVSLSYKNEELPNQRIKITGSASAFEILQQHWDESTIELLEEFKILLLNRTHKVLGISTISSGGVAGTLVDLI